VGQSRVIREFDPDKTAQSRGFFLAGTVGTPWRERLCS